MLRIQLSLLLLICVVPFFLHGQEKYERESRIKIEEVPLIAQSFLSNIPNTKKVKWYREERLNGYSIEAKFKLNDYKYSIEFDTLGRLEDVEVLIPEDVIPTDVLHIINEKMGQLFSRYRIRKSQIQYTGQPESLLALIKQEATTASYVTKFELVVKGYTEQGINLYEMLFDEEGHLLSKSKIVLKNANNLEY